MTTSPSTTCPSSCPLKGQGCYADGGPLRLHWDKVTKGERGLNWSQFLHEIESLPEGQLWRHNQAGDLVGCAANRSDAIDKLMLGQLVIANRGKRGFTYTHYEVLEPGYTGDWNRDAIYNANARGFTINLSADNFEEADRMVKLNIAPVTVLLPSSTSGKITHTPGRNKIATCPATIREDISCDKCALCSRVNRPFIVGFPTHGARKTTVDRFLSILEDNHG